MEALRTVTLFTVADGVAKTINFSYTIILSTCPICVGFRPTVLASSFCIIIKFLMSCSDVQSEPAPEQST